MAENSERGQRRRLEVRGWIVAAGLFFLGWGAATAWGQLDWASKPAAITTGEYLDLLFQFRYGSEEKESLNTFALASFLPGSREDEAVVLIHQAWHDERLKDRPADFRREVRKVAAADLENFESLRHLREITRRWPHFGKPETDRKHHLVIRHFRATDWKETLGVTLDGETHFDPEAYAAAKRRLAALGYALP